MYWYMAQKQRNAGEEQLTLNVKLGFDSTAKHTTPKLVFRAPLLDILQ